MGPTGWMGSRGPGLQGRGRLKERPTPVTLRFTAGGDKHSITRDRSEEMEDSDWLGRRNHTPGSSSYVIPGNGPPGASGSHHLLPGPRQCAHLPPTLLPITEPEPKPDQLTGCLATLRGLD